MRDDCGITLSIMRRLLDQLVADSKFEFERAQAQTDVTAAADHRGRSLGIDHAQVRLMDLCEKEFGADFHKHPAWTGESML